ncbi:hypothetical protein HKCCE3408_09580 [Rhodobacterales bacterium HKCCE3408]|nr:hypothetical protein [Rhodobacterales bacterium HKCCE3408]
MKLHTLASTAAIAALIAGGAVAQSSDSAAPAADDQATANEMAQMYTSIDEMTVGDVVGMTAYDPNGDAIADIDYVTMVDDVPNAVLGIGGFLGLGEYTVAMPLEDFDLREDGNSFLLNADKQTLESMPEFDETGVESLPDDTMIAQILPQDTEGDMMNDEDTTASEPATGDMLDEETEETGS